MFAFPKNNEVANENGVVLEVPRRTRAHEANTGAQVVKSSSFPSLDLDHPLARTHPLNGDETNARGNLGTLPQPARDDEKQVNRAQGLNCDGVVLFRLDCCLPINPTSPPTAV